MMDEEPQFPYFKPLDVESKKETVSSKTGTTQRSVDSVDYDQYRYRPENELSFIDYDRDRIKMEDPRPSAMGQIRISAMMTSESVPDLETLTQSPPHKPTRRGSVASSIALSTTTRMTEDEDEVTDPGSTTVFTANITHEIQSIINEVDEDEDGFLDREQFVDFLSEWNLHQKYAENELDVIFKELVESGHRMDGDDDEEE